MLTTSLSNPGLWIPRGLQTVFILKFQPMFPVLFITQWLCFCTFFKQIVKVEKNLKMAPAPRQSFDVPFFEYCKKVQVVFVIS